MESTVRMSMPGTTDAVAPAFRSHAVTDVGRVRRANEDNYLDRADLGLWVVADGVGGMRGGKEASELVVRLLGEVSPPANAAAFLADVRDRIETAHRELGPLGYATTIVALLAFGQHYACVWAGDSRMYMVRDGVLSQVTRDHSQVQLLVDQGLLTQEQARKHPSANVVTRVVGGGDVPLDLEMLHAALVPGDTFLICSDGLTKVIEDHEIERLIIENSGHPDASGLLQLALDRGAPDNVTIVVVQYCGGVSTEGDGSR